MFESKLLSMQKLAIEGADSGAEAWILDCVIASTTIHLITNHGMLQPREVHTNLVRPSRL